MGLEKNSVGGAFDHPGVVRFYKCFLSQRAVFFVHHYHAVGEMLWFVDIYTYILAYICFLFHVLINSFIQHEFRGLSHSKSDSSTMKAHEQAFLYLKASSGAVSLNLSLPS